MRTIAILGAQELRQGLVGQFLCSMWHQLRSLAHQHSASHWTEQEAHEGLTHVCHALMLLSHSCSLWLAWTSSQHSGLKVDGLLAWWLTSRKKHSKSSKSRNYRFLKAQPLKLHNAVPTTFYSSKPVREQTQIQFIAILKLPPDSELLEGMERILLVSVFPST